MKRNVILITIGVIILNIAFCVYLVHRVKVKTFTFIKHHFEGNFITSKTIEHKRYFLGLSDGQVNTMKEIDKEYDKKEEKYRKKLVTYMAELRDTILADNINEYNIRKIMEKIDNERREIRILNIKEIFEFEKELSEKQKAKLKDYINKFHNKDGRPGESWADFL